MPPPTPQADETGYTELRRHEFTKRMVQMVDGNLTLNNRASEGATSARVYRQGYWGFASAPGTADGSLPGQVQAQAESHARALSRFGPAQAWPLPGGSHRGEHVFQGARAWTQTELVDYLGALQAFCRARYPGLTSVRLMAQDEHHSKWLRTSRGGESLASIQRAALNIVFSAAGTDGAPVELWHRLSAKGSLADLGRPPEQLADELDDFHRHLMAKCEAVPARGGNGTVVMAPELAGILAHEAMGHPCEADIVLGGAVTGRLLGQAVASEKITMVDIAHTWQGQEVMCPVYVDDEGTPAEDAVLIDRGRLGGLMHSRETAARMGLAPTGSARAYGPSDEPLVRMRNTFILPGTDRLDDMVAGVDDGYLLLKTGNGQADSTTEFMFGVTLGYEIRGGRLGRAIRDTTVSGSALKVLQSVDAVSEDMHVYCGGYCGKKQPMVVSMGGPAIRARAHLGGQ